MSDLVPELDFSARRFNIRMTEGDAIEFMWLVPNAAGWAGTYEFKVDCGDYPISLSCSVVAQDGDALFTVSDAPQEKLVHKPSGYLWSMRQTGGTTRFSGLIFVDGNVA